MFKEIKDVVYRMFLLAVCGLGVAFMGFLLSRFLLAMYQGFIQ